MPHYTGTGPAYSTATACIVGSTDRAAIFTDVGLAIPKKNPFVVEAGLYDFYSAVACYVAFGVDRPIYEDLAAEKLSFDEYLAPRDFPV